MSSEKELFTIEGFNKLRTSTLHRVNKAINSSTSIVESAKKCSDNVPISYKLLNLIPGAIETPKRDKKVSDDLFVTISRRYSSKIDSKLQNKKKLDIKSGINGIIKDWNIVEGSNNNIESNNGEKPFKDFVTEAKAAEFVIKFLDRMQSKKYAMNYENVSLHVKGETQLDRQLSAYPLFVSTISHSSMGISGIKRDIFSLYDAVGNANDGNIGAKIGNFKNNKQIFDRNPLVQLSLELEKDLMKERAPSWAAKLLPSIGTKLDYLTPPEEKALGVYSKDQVTSDAIVYRQMNLYPSAGRMGSRYKNINDTTLFINSKDDSLIIDDSSNIKGKKSQNNQNSNLQIITDLNKIPVKFPWILEHLPIAQSFKNQVLLFNDNSSTSKDESKENNLKKSFYQKAKSLSSGTNLRQENVIKAIISNRGVAMVRNISMIPADSNIEAYFDELDDNSDNDERFLWDDDRERRNCSTKEIGVQKYMEENSFDENSQNNKEDFDTLMKNLEIKYKQLLEERNNEIDKQGNNCQSSSFFDNESKDYKDIHLLLSNNNNVHNSQNTIRTGISSNIIENEMGMTVGLNTHINPEIKIEYDLSELYDSSKTVYKGEGIEKTWNTYLESLKNYRKLENERKEYLEKIHYNSNPLKKQLNGSQSRKSKLHKSFLPIQEYLQQEDDPQEEYYKFIQGQRMIKESMNRFPIQDKYLYSPNNKLIGSNSKGHIRGLGAVRGGRKIYERYYSDRTQHEKDLRSRIEDLGFLEYNERDRLEFLEHVRYNNEKISEKYDIEDKLKIKTRISLRGRFKKKNHLRIK